MCVKVKHLTRALELEKGSGIEKTHPCIVRGDVRRRKSQPANRSR